MGTGDAEAKASALQAENKDAINNPLSSIMRMTTPIEQSKNSQLAPCRLREAP